MDVKKIDKYIKVLLTESIDYNAYIINTYKLVRYFRQYFKNIDVVNDYLLYSKIEILGTNTNIFNYIEKINTLVHTEDKMLLQEIYRPRKEVTLSDFLSINNKLTLNNKLYLDELLDSIIVMLEYLSNTYRQVTYNSILLQQYITHVVLIYVSMYNQHQLNQKEK